MASHHPSHLGLVMSTTCSVISPDRVLHVVRRSRSPVATTFLSIRAMTREIDGVQYDATVSVASEVATARRTTGSLP